MCSTFSVPSPQERCQDPGTPQNGQRRVSDPSMSIDTRIEFTCQAGFRMEGPPVIVCLRHGAWDSEPPSCVRDRPPSELTVINEKLCWVSILWS